MAIEMDGHNADALCARAEAYIDQELYEEGTTIAYMITLSSVCGENTCQ